MTLKLCINRTLALILCAITFLCGCSSQTDRNRESPQPAFRFDQQIGIANLQTDKTGCLALANPSIKPGVKVTLVDQPGEHLANTTTPIIDTATVEELLSQACDDNHLLSNELSNSGPTYYRIRLDHEWKGNGYVFAIIPPSGAMTTSGQAIEGDLDEDGTKETFRICSSSEGLHYQVWTGQPLTGQPRWHWYVYLGYDVDPSCTDKEYFGPK